MTETYETDAGALGDIWVDATAAMAAASDLGPLFLVDADPTDRRALIALASRMRADIRSTSAGGVGSRLARLAALAERAEQLVASSGDTALEVLVRDLAATRRELSARARARVRFCRRIAREARRRRTLALRPLSEPGRLERESA